MPLTLVSTPIGHDDDLTKRAIDVLTQADLVIGEERKEVSKLLKRLGLQKPIELLNEHSRELDVKSLADICAVQNVALVTDCGTPGFCDPGADLVRELRRRKISVTAAPGVSSLATFLSLSGHRLDRFVFAGFLPRETNDRNHELQRVMTSHVPTIVMDTPYRLEKLISEITDKKPNQKLVLGLNLTQESEAIVEGAAHEIKGFVAGKKGEFLLLILPSTSDGGKKTLQKSKMPTKK